MTDHEEVFVDGTKIESKANRYTFVWRKTVERELRKIRGKAKELLGLTEGYVTKGKLEEKVRALDKEIEEKDLHVEKGRGHRKPEVIRLRNHLSTLFERWSAYELKLKTLGSDRNSFSKTDPDATFIRDILLKSDRLKTIAKNNTVQDFEFSYFDDILRDHDRLVVGVAHLRGERSVFQIPDRNTLEHCDFSPIFSVGLLYHICFYISSH